jgi:hypothetical protein
VAEKPNPVDRLEIASAIVLSVAALASSWATYEAGLWDGEQATHYTRANNLRIEASRMALEGDVLASAEVQMFSAWLQAKARDEAALADFYQARFPPSLKPAFNAWLAEQPFTNPSAPLSPFSTPGYKRPGRAAADRLDSEAAKAFAEGQYANAVSDAFQQSATILALALFFGGIGQVFKSRAPRLVLLTVAFIALVGGLLRLFGLPIQILGLHPPTVG